MISVIARQQELLAHSDNGHVGCIERPPKIVAFVKRWRLRRDGR